MSDITCSMHGVHPGSFTFSLVDAYIYHEYLKKIFAVDAVCVQRAVTLSRQWTQTASKAAERVKFRIKTAKCMEEAGTGGLVNLDGHIKMISSRYQQRP